MQKDRTSLCRGPDSRSCRRGKGTARFQASTWSLLRLRTWRALIEGGGTRRGRERLSEVRRRERWDTDERVWGDNVAFSERSEDKWRKHWTGSREGGRQGRNAGKEREGGRHGRDGGEGRLLTVWSASSSTAKSGHAPRVRHSAREADVPNICGVSTEHGTARAARKLTSGCGERKTASDGTQLRHEGVPAKLPASASVMLASDTANCVNGRIGFSTWKAACPPAGPAKCRTCLARTGRLVRALLMPAAEPRGRRETSATHSTIFRVMTWGVLRLQGVEGRARGTTKTP